MSDRTENNDIEIKDLPPEETLTPEEKEQLAGAGRYHPMFEALEAREMMDAGIGGALTTSMAATGGGAAPEVGHVRVFKSDGLAASTAAPAITVEMPAEFSAPVNGDGAAIQLGSVADSPTMQVPVADAQPQAPATAAEMAAAHGDPMMVAGTGATPIADVPQGGGRAAPAALSVSSGAAATSNAAVTPVATSDMTGKLVFSDNFDKDAVGSRPDTNTWRRDNGKDNNNNNVTYTNKKDTLHVVEDSGAEDGKALALTINKVGNDAKGNPLFESARITTVANNFEYGRVEARIRLEKVDGKDPVWPAFWMLGSDISTVGWPNCGEIDILEYNGGGGTTAGTLVTPDAKYRHQNYYTGASLGDGQYHTFAIEWSPGSVTFLVDGNAYATVKKGNNKGEIPADQWNFDKPFYIILNVAAFPGQKADFTSQTMFVDYVRAYSSSTPTSASGNNLAMSAPTMAAATAAPATTVAMAAPTMAAATAAPTTMVAMAAPNAAAAEAVPATLSKFAKYDGASDASAVVPVRGGTYIFVADDKSDVIRLYDSKGGKPVAVFDFSNELGTKFKPDGTGSSSDIEGVTLVGDMAYWIGSGGDGKSNVIFATRVHEAPAPHELPSLEFVGKYTDMRKAIAGVTIVIGKDANGKDITLSLADAQNASTSRETKGAYGIEGIVMKPGDTTAYIAFRGPVVGGKQKALLLPVTNFTKLFETPAPGAKAATPKFGTPIQLDLGGRGFRDIVYNAEWKKFVILAGNPGTGSAQTLLYVWDGPGTEKVNVLMQEGVANNDPNNDPMSFEAIGNMTGNLADGTAQVQLIADQGSIKSHGKDIDDTTKRPFDDRYFYGEIYTVPAKLGKAATSAS